MKVSEYLAQAKKINIWYRVFLTTMVVSTFAYTILDGYACYFKAQNEGKLEQDIGSSPTPSPSVEPSPEPTPEPNIEPSPSPIPSPAPTFFNASIECFDLIDMKREGNVFSGLIKWKCPADKGSSFNYKVTENATTSFTSRLSIVDNLTLNSTTSFTFNPCNKLIENKTTIGGSIYLVRIQGTEKSYPSIKVPLMIGAYTCK
jgi:hypothetical protein